MQATDYISTVQYMYVQSALTYMYSTGHRKLNHYIKRLMKHYTVVGKQKFTSWS